MVTGILVTGSAFAQPSISYTPVTPSCVGSDVTVGGVTISDAAGVPTSGALMPRIYFKKNAGAWFSAQGTLTSGSGTSGTWDFVIPAATLGGLSTGNTVSYYIVAQNNSAAIDANPSTGFSATDVNTVITPPTTPNSYTVSALPSIATLTTSASTICVGNSFTLTAGTTSGPGSFVAYNWSGPLAYSAATTANNVSIVPASTTASGFYSVTATYSGSGCTSAVRSVNVTVNGALPAIGGAANVCVGSTGTLTNASGGGVWSSSNTGIATINASSGLASGISAGTVTITYALGSCNTTTVLTVDPLPFAITGTTGVCIGNTTALSNASSGGTWSTSNPSIATVGSGTGVVTGVSNGLVNITYTLPTGCRRSTILTVYPFPSNLAGTLTVCEGSTTALSSAPTGGTWASSDGSVATVSGSGVVTGILAGTSTITYTLSTGCYRTADVTVNPLPAAITGPTSVCSGSNITLSSTTGGGAWSSSAPAVASVNFSTGVVTGSSGGAATMTYTLGTGCRVTYGITAYITPNTISGATVICEGTTTTLTNTTGGGSWSSSNGGVANIGISTGFVTAVGAGTTNITYTVPSGCYRVMTMTVNAAPVAIVGASSICIGSTTTLTDATPTGTWSSSNTSRATINTTTGLVSGIAAGTVNMTYKLPSSCQTIHAMTVNALPASIGGTAVVCEGSTTVLSNTTPGGTWASSLPAIGSISAGGVLSGLTAGTTDITYTLSTGCIRTKTATVNPLPAAIGGSLSICPSSTSTLTNATAGGTWSSSTPSVAAIAVSTGLITGNAVGTATISYRLSTGCTMTGVATVNPFPANITGSGAVCLGSTTTLSDADAGGAWSTSNGLVATVSVGGVVTGNALGTAHISYTLPTGCYRTLVVTVNAVPTPLAGTFVVCEGSTTDITSAPGSGIWSSSNPAVATAGPASGAVGGVSMGTATISYTIGNGCSATATVSVNPRPAPITGALTVCIGFNTTLSNVTPSGVWSSSNPAVGSVDAAGVVTGMSASQTTISYTLPTGCARTAVVSVNPLPAVITGPTNVCEGSNITLTSSPYVTGTWSSSDVTVATVGVSGVVTGVDAGVANLSFIFPTGCYRTVPVTVNQAPSPIGGTTSVCSGSTTTLTNTVPGGVWTSAAGAILVVDATTGVVTGVSSGMATVTYSLGSGCRATVVVTTYITPPPISGPGTVCVGSTMTLANSQAGGTWTSSTPANATISLIPGLVTGIAPGTSTIVYTSAQGCTTSTIITVNATPVPATGSLSVCVGGNTALSSATPGGLWYSSATAVATVGAATGIVTGVSSGTATISYRVPSGCYTPSVVTVNGLPGAITGAGAVCLGSTTAMASVTTGGTWSSSDPSVASVDVVGAATGVSVGTAMITYTIGTGCFVTRTMTVNPLPLPIAGTAAVCDGSTTGLTDATVGGTWSSNNTSIATVTPTGVVTGISPGTANIIYTLGTTCSQSVTVTVSPTPAPITGVPLACVNNTSSLSDVTPGGTWSSNSIFNASVDAFGLVTAHNAGFATISYTMPGGCKSTVQFTVQALPSVITGTPQVCAGSSSTLVSVPTTGIWSSSDPLVAIVSSTGVVTGIAAGTSTISYSLTTGCNRTVVFTVNPLPPVSTGGNTVCLGTSVTLANSMTGGMWTSNNPPIASVDPVTGVVTAHVVGTANISYVMPTGCRTVTNMTVLSLPQVIGGTPIVCEGASTVVTDATAGGTWSSANTSVATVGSGSGILTGVSAGLTDITYTVISTGCYRTRTATVNAVPAAITGPMFVCVGSTTTLSSTTLGGSWISSATSVATVNSVTGLVTGVSAGTATITYKMNTGCQVTAVLTVNFLPGALSGSSSVCVGASTVYTSLTPGGAWSSSNPLVAAVDPSTGVITGITNGTAIITYTLGTGCLSTRMVSVFPLPSAIAGTLSFCQGSTSHLTSLTPGGTWSSSNTFVATVGLSNGLVSGLSAGTSNIIYTVGTGCSQVVTVSINPAPTAIIGIANICLGTTSTFTSLTSGGSWSSSNPLVASIDAGTGVATGITTGTAILTYMVGTGCQATQAVTVSPLPANITGTPTVCQGSTTTLMNTSAGGTWSTTDITIATVSSTGVVTGVTPGLVTISYTMPSGCAKTMSFTVNPVPTDISGSLSVCTGLSSTLSSSTPGGVWTSSNPSIATIGVTSGLMDGVSPGTARITYSLSTSCRLIQIATVFPVPTAITGVTSVCEGSTTTLFNGVSGGVWSSDFLDVAIVDATTGVVTGTGPVVDTIRYTLAGGCSTKITVTVTPAPPSIIGDRDICVAENSTLTNGITGGTWSSADPSIVTIGVSSGILTGVSSGVTNVTYTLGAGCRVIGQVTVNAAPSVITGPSQICMGQSVNLYNAIPGGTWVSQDVSVASVDGTTGVVTGIAANIDTIRYILPGGCYAAHAITVNATPPVIDGADSVCRGLTTTLTNLVPGGIWMSSDPSVAPIGLSTGVVLGVSPGTSIISYTLLGTGCTRTTIMTVQPLPDPITGTTNICVGGLTTLATTSIGGSWSSSDPFVAVVGVTTGFVTGLSDGVATITYTLPTGCYTTALVVVNPLPDPIVGADDICVGSATTMTDATPFGTWSSSDVTTATIGSASGVVTGVGFGTATLSYTLLTTGCYVTKQLTLNPIPPTISGNVNICIGSTTFLTNLASGGTWSSSTPAVASIDAFGNVTSGSVGTTTITYTLGTACYVTRVLHVEPTLNPITGVSNVCEFASITLGNDYVGGVWTSSNGSVATVGSASGVVTGVSAGPVTITYATPLAGCSATATLTVDPVPVEIFGDSTVCEGFTTTLTDATPGGTWSTSDASIASIGSASGILTGLVGNVVTVSYTIGTGCTATKSFTVNPQPHAGTITGPTAVCLNSLITLASSTADGKWWSPDTSIALIDSVTGVLTGNGAGTVLISYVYTNMCASDTSTVSILVKPLPDAGTLSGNAGLCINYTSTLSSTVPGGVWSSSNTSVATVGAASGVVTALAAGTSTITYLMTTDCGTDTATMMVTVHVMAPHTAIKIHPDDTICLKSQFVNFGADSSTPSGITYIWTATNAEVYAISADRQNAVFNFWDPGTAVVRLTTQYISTGCFVTDSFVVHVTNDAAYTPEVKYFAKELICTDNIANSYQWGYDDAATLDSTLIPGAVQQSYYLPNPDFVNRRYWVISNRGGCQQKVYYNAPTDVAPVVLGNIDVKLFPNPTDSRINIEISGTRNSDEISIRVIDMLGKEVAAEAIVNGKGSVDVTPMAPGIYSVMVISNGEKVASKTFVKK